MEIIKFYIYGVIMGCANVIPGVSGGTIAIILNFYDILMESITLNIRVIYKNIKFIIPLGLGVLSGIIGLSKVMEYLLVYYSSQTFSGFLGVVVGSLPLIWHKAKNNQKNIDKRLFIPFFISLGLMIGLSLFSQVESGLTVYETLSFEAFIVLFIGMFIASMTMIIPGISGSLVLIILGLYSTIYGYAIAKFNIGLLVPIGLGAICGIFVAARVISYLLSNYQEYTYMAILGLLFGSIFDLYKRISFDSIGTIFISLIVFVLMVIIIGLFSYYEIRNGK